MDPDFLRDFRRTLDESRERLTGLSDAEASRPPAPGKWSPKEIIGHLIDSAANNHARFVRAQATDDLLFDGYDQEAYNHHLANVMERADPGVLNMPRARHSLDRIAFQPLDPSRPATLGYVMSDYVAHLKHHLNQIA
jgi:hypothetical protein